MMTSVTRGGPDGRIPARALLGVAGVALWLILPCQRAIADPRFGDSTWVAPDAPSSEDPASPGPRVALPEREPTWETVLRTPFRIAFLPLRGLARGIEAVGPVVEHFVPPGHAFTPPSTEPRLKIAPAVSYSGSAGPGLGLSVSVPRAFGPTSRLSATGTVSLRDNRRARARALIGENRPVGFGAEAVYDYRPNRRFYGLGNESPDVRRIYLRDEKTAAGYVLLGPDPMRRVRASAGLLHTGIGGGYNGSGSLQAAAVFTPSEVPYVDRGSNGWWYGIAGDVAALDDSLNPSLGIHIRSEGRRVQGTGSSDFEFDTWRAEGRTYLPLFATHRVLATRLVYEALDPRSGSGPVPFYRLPTAIDANRFVAYSQGRFVDRRLAMAHVEYRWNLIRGFWAFGLAQWGEVASTTKALRIRDAHPSYGGGFRTHIGRSRTARLDIATGDDGVNVYVDLKGDF